MQYKNTAEFSVPDVLRFARSHKQLKMLKTNNPSNFADDTSFNFPFDEEMHPSEKLIRLFKDISPLITLSQFKQIIALMKANIADISNPFTRNKLFDEIVDILGEDFDIGFIIALIDLMRIVKEDQDLDQSDVEGIINFINAQYIKEVRPNIVDNEMVIGYKGKAKVEALKKQFDKLQVVKNNVTASFPLKRNIRSYQLHRVDARYSYIIDLMFEDRGIVNNAKASFCYLLAININTRYLYAALMNKVINAKNNSYGKVNVKTSKAFIRALERMYANGIIIRHLFGDSEKCFWSDEAQTFYINHNIIDYWPVPRQRKIQYPAFMTAKRHLNDKTQPLHGALSIVDRVIRTLRDMAFHMEVDVITPQIMEALVIQYNNAPHTTLSKYAGFPVSPSQAQSDIELEDLIARRIAQENYMIRQRTGFYIPIGKKVKVYNEKDVMNKRRCVIQPGDLEVIAFTEGLYVIKNNDNNELQSVPRWKLQPLD